MNLRLPLLSFLLVFLCHLSIAQPTWLWGESFGSSDDEYPEDMITDNQGNIYVTGVMADTCIIGNDTLYGSTGTSGSAFGHAYIAKYDSAGNVLWATGPEEGDSWSRIYNLVQDEAGNIYASGYQYDSLQWQGNTYGAWGFSYLLIKLSSGGDIIWIKQMNTAFWPRQIIYHNGLIWMPNSSSSSFTLDTVTITYPSGSDRDLHVFALDTATGTAVSGFRIDLEGTQYMVEMTFGNDHLYVEGLTNDTVFVGNDSVYVSSGYKAFVVKADLQGNLKWVNSLYRTSSGASGSEQELKIGPAGNFYCLQEFTGTIEIEDTSITALGSRDLLLVKITSNGELDYFKHMGSTNFEIVGGLHPMSSGKLIVSGQCGNPFSVNGEVKSAIGSSRPFIAEFAADGTYLTYQNSSSNGSGFFHRLDEAPGNKFAAFGKFNNISTFGTASVTGSGRQNMVFMGKLDSCELTQPEIVVVPSCNSDSILLKTDTSNVNFLWSTGETNDSIYVYNDGQYNVLISDTNYCSAFSEWENIALGESLTLSISDSIMKCIEDSIWIDASKDGAVYWSTGTYADSILINSPQTIYAFDSLPGCQLLSDTLLVKNFPRDSGVALTSSDTGYCPQSNMLVTTTNSYSSYNWMNGATSASIMVNSTNPVYVEIIDNNGCLGYSDTLIPLAYTAPTPIITQNDTSICIGDSISLSTSQSYSQYLWNTSATTQSIWVNQTMNYSVTVTDSNGCSGTTPGTQVNIQPLPVFTLSHVGFNAICDSQLVYLSASDTSLQYTWNTAQTTDSILITQNGMYSTIATDSIGCVSNSDTVEFVLSNPLASISPQGPTEFCAGESVDLNGTPGMSAYNWSTGNNTPNVTVNNTQLVTLIITDSVGCMDTSSALQVTRYPLPAKPVVSVSGNDLSTTAIGQLQWQLNGTAISGATSNTITVTSNGAYTVIVTDSNTCSNESDPFSFTWLGLPELTSSEFIVFPNPAKDVLNIRYQGSLKGQIRMYDMQGALVYQSDRPVDQINVSHLEKGSYILVFQNDDAITFKQRFVIK